MQDSYKGNKNRFVEISTSGQANSKDPTEILHDRNKTKTSFTFIIES